jgi:hypothetical protein
MFNPILHDAFIKATVDERLRGAEMRRVRAELRRGRRRETPEAETSRRAPLHPWVPRPHRH